MVALKLFESGDLVLAQRKLSKNRRQVRVGRIGTITGRNFTERLFIIAGREFTTRELTLLVSKERLEDWNARGLLYIQKV